MCNVGTLGAMFSCEEETVECYTYPIPLIFTVMAAPVTIISPAVTLKIAVCKPYAKSVLLKISDGYNESVVGWIVFPSIWASKAPADPSSPYR